MTTYLNNKYNRNKITSAISIKSNPKYILAPGH